MERQRQAERVRRWPRLPFQDGRSLAWDEEGGTPSPAYGVGCPLAPPGTAPRLQDPGWSGRLLATGMCKRVARLQAYGKDR